MGVGRQSFGLRPGSCLSEKEYYKYFLILSDHTRSVFFEQKTKNEFCRLNHTLYPSPSMIFNASIIHFLNAIYVCRRSSPFKSLRVCGCIGG